MKKSLNLIKTILKLLYIPIILYIIYLQFFKDYSYSGFMSGLESLGDMIALILLLIFNTLLLYITGIINNAYDYKKLGVKDKKKEKKIKYQLLIVSLIIFIVSFIPLYYYIAGLLAQTTEFTLEPTKEEIVLIVEEEDWGDLFINEYNYTVEVESIENETTTSDGAIEIYFGFYNCIVRVKETNEVYRVLIEKTYDKTNITKQKRNEVLRLAAFTKIN